jgi:hypothetical protein
MPQIERVSAPFDLQGAADLDKLIDSDLVEIDSMKDEEARVITEKLTDRAGELNRLGNFPFETVVSFKENKEHTGVESTLPMLMVTFANMPEQEGWDGWKFRYFGYYVTPDGKLTGHMACEKAGRRIIHERAIPLTRDELIEIGPGALEAIHRVNKLAANQ